MNKTLSAFNKLIAFNKEFKNAKRVYRSMQILHNNKEKSDGVFCASIDLYSIEPLFFIEMNKGNLISAVVNSMDKHQLNLLKYFWGLHLFGTWRNTLGVYEIDPDIFHQVISSPIPPETPSNIFQRLPEWSVYFNTPAEQSIRMTTTSGREAIIDGFWALLDYDIDPQTESRRLVLNIALNISEETSTAYDAFQPMRFTLDDNMTVNEAYDKLYDDDFLRNGLDALKMNVGRNENRELLFSLLSLLLWVCVEEPDISNILGEPLTRERIANTSVTINKKTGRFIPPAAPVIRVLGARLGGEIRTFNQVIEDDCKKIKNSRKRPHIRKGHWHGYWYGTGQNKEFKVKWQDPIFVNS